MGDPERNWDDIQRSIDTCSICKCQSGVLFNEFQDSRGRPPKPPQKGCLFISEAPTPRGGFWADPVDSLRKNLFEFLNLPERESELREFTENFSLIQTFKWPLRIDLSGLEPKRIRPLSEHTSKAHIMKEIMFMRPRAIMALGSVAVSALSWLLADSATGERFAKERIKSFKGEPLDAEIDGRPIQVWATYLPAGQGTRNKKAIFPDIRGFSRSCSEQSS